MNKKILPNPIKYRPFSKARAFVHTLNIKSYPEWVKLCREGLIPKDIPFNPAYVYKKEYISNKDWFGLADSKGEHKKCKPYSEAEAFVHALHLNSVAEWKKYCKSNKKPSDIPSGPDIVYKNKGWVDWPTFLGNNRIASKFVQYRPFIEARAFMRSLKLPSYKAYDALRKSGDLPHDIPYNPQKTYKGKFKSMSDWLGVNLKSIDKGNYRSYEETKKWAREKGLKSKREYEAYSRSGKKPRDVPSAPYRVYKNKGWISWLHFFDKVI